MIDILFSSVMEKKLNISDSWAELPARALAVDFRGSLVSG